MPKTAKPKASKFDWALVRGPAKSKATDVTHGDIAPRHWTHGWQSDDYDFPPSFEHSPIGGTKTQRINQYEQS